MKPFDDLRSQAEAEQDWLAQDELVMQELEALLTSTPMVEPPAGFVDRFEARLERRLSRRRTVLGVSVLSVVLVAAAALLFWNVTDAGLALLNTLLSFDVMNSLVNSSIGLLEGGLVSLTVLGRLLVRLAETSMLLLSSPVFWGYITLAIGIVAFWTQLLRRLMFSQLSVAPGRQIS